MTYTGYRTRERYVPYFEYIRVLCFGDRCCCCTALIFGWRNKSPEDKRATKWYKTIGLKRTNTPMENVETPSAFQTSFLEAMLGELGTLSCLVTRHGSFTSTFRRRILRGGYTESPAGWSFDPSAEGAMTTARPPLSLIICPCLSLLSTDYYS